MIDDKYIIGRYGVNDVESYDFNNPQFYGYDEQTEFCDFDTLPFEFKKPIEELKQKIKMIDDASTIGKVQKDDYIPDPQEGSKKTWEYMNTPEYKRQEQYLQSTNSKINSEPEPYNSFPLGKITKLEQDFNDLQNKFKESVKLTENCLTSFINETIKNKINETKTETINEATLTITKLRQFSGIIGLKYTIENKEYEECNQIQKLWTYEDVKELVKKWIRQRMVDKKTNLCVLLSNVETLMYCYEGNIVEEPSIRVYGEIVRPNADIPDGEIKKTLLELFTYLKETLKQYSVRFNFQGYNENVSIRIS